VIVPLATPWQYCVTLFSQELLPALPKKLCRTLASLDGSFPLHCEPQSTRYTFGAVSTPIPFTPPW
jgi:hypothetical protein